MTLKQKFWLYFLLVYSLIHIVRDILQDAGIKVLLSTVLVKKPANSLAASILWTSLNTYVIAIIEIILAIICLRRNDFGKLGLLTIVIAAITLISWLFYWFLL